MRAVLAAFALVALSGCTSLSDVDCVSGEGEPYFPLAVGNWWRFELEFAGEPPSEKWWWVKREEPGQVFVIQKIDFRPDYSWTQQRGDRTEWVRKLWTPENDPMCGQVFEPAAQRVDASEDRLCKGDSWTESYVRRDSVIDEDDCTAPVWRHGATGCAGADEVVVRERWTVTDVRRTVRAGGREFRDCLCERREVLDGDGKNSEFCFARGVGKVLEDATDHETLIDFCADGSECACPDASPCGTVDGSCNCGEDPTEE